MNEIKTLNCVKRLGVFLSGAGVGRLDFARECDLWYTFLMWKTVKEFFVKEFDSVNFCFNIFNDEWLFKQLGELTTLGVNVQSLSNFNNDYPNTSRSLDFDVKNFRSLCDNGLLKIDDKEFDNILEYLRLAIEINKKFSDVPVFDFNSDKENSALSQIWLSLSVQSLTSSYEIESNGSLFL